MLLTIFNVYQLCSHFLSTMSRTEETGFFTKTEKKEASHSSVSSAFSSAPKCSDHSTAKRWWDTTYQLSPLVKVLLLSSSFFSTASSSTAVCSKSAETESWGEKEASCEEMTLRDCSTPSLCGEDSPRAAPSPPAHTELSAALWAQLAQLPQHVQLQPEHLLCPACANSVLACPASSWQLCKLPGGTHTSLTPRHAPHPSASWAAEFSKCLAQDKGISGINRLIILLHLTTHSNCKYKHTSLHFSIVTATQTLLLVLFRRDLFNLSSCSYCFFSAGYFRVAVSLFTFPVLLLLIFITKEVIPTCWFLSGSTDFSKANLCSTLLRARTQF